MGGFEEDFQYVYGKTGRNQDKDTKPYQVRNSRIKSLDGKIAGKANGVFQRVQYYTKPLVTPIGINKGLNVYKNITNSYVNYLNWICCIRSVRTVGERPGGGNPPLLLNYNLL